MRVTPPVQITAAKVVSTNVSETPPAAWNSGTTYAKGDLVSDTTNHLEYKSTQGSNTNHPITDGEWWELTGPTNPYRMFDLTRQRGTSRTGNVTTRFKPGQRCDILAATNLVADELVLKVYAGAGGSPVRTDTVNLRKRNSRSWSEYFFGDFGYQSKALFLNLPLFSGVEFELIATRASGDATIGSVACGKSIYLGTTLFDPQLDSLNFSEIERSTSGNLATLKAERTIPTVEVGVLVYPNSVDTVLKVIADLDATPALWTGVDDTDHAFFGALTMIAIYRKMPMRRREDECAELTAQLEEV